MEKWMPIFWIFVISGGFFVLLLVIDYLKGLKKRF